jgi:hypothetical protein
MDGVLTLDKGRASSASQVLSKEYSLVCIVAFIVTVVDL